MKMNIKKIIITALASTSLVVSGVAIKGAADDFWSGHNDLAQTANNIDAVASAYNVKKEN